VAIILTPPRISLMETPLAAADRVMSSDMNAMSAEMLEVSKRSKLMEPPGMCRISVVRWRMVERRRSVSSESRVSGGW